MPLGEAKPGEDLSKTLPVNPCCSDLVEEGTETWQGGFGGEGPNVTLPKWPGDKEHWQAPVLLGQPCPQAVPGAEAEQVINAALP